MTVLPPPINARHVHALRAYAQPSPVWQGGARPHREQLLEIAVRMSAHILKAREVGDSQVRLLGRDDATLVTAVAQTLIDDATARFPNPDAFSSSSLGNSLLEVGTAIHAVVTSRYL